ncbi:hypothetical protein ACFVUH_14635 [Kitasatospora sp. NPDC058032]|uniref:hypothetical protein n=1 Tax=unclassified Kitasatospora TaxID=2633591 RepID=UPI0033B6229C
MSDDPAGLAVTDQIRAAGDHAERLLIASGRPAPVRTTPDRAAPWFHETRAVMLRAEADGTLRHCDHLAAPQPTAILAEAADRLVCWDCYTRAQALRSCHICGGPAGTKSLYGGVEAVIRGPAAVYSRVVCRSCAEPAGPRGTFGNGG